MRRLAQKVRRAVRIGVAAIVPTTRRDERTRQSHQTIFPHHPSRVSRAGKLREEHSSSEFVYQLRRCFSRRVGPRPLRAALSPRFCPAAHAKARTHRARLRTRTCGAKLRTRLRRKQHLHIHRRAPRLRPFASADTNFVKVKRATPRNSARRIALSRRHLPHRPSQRPTVASAQWSSKCKVTRTKHRFEARSSSATSK